MTQKKNNGIYLTKHKNHELDIALVSLNIGIQSYYSTYQSIRGALDVIQSRPSEELFNFDENDNRYEALHIKNYNLSTTTYVKGYIETIFHFHHFIEVSIKEILRQEHELLPSVAGQKHTILHKILKNEDITDDEREKLNTIDFGESIGRIIELIKNQRIKNYENMKFINEAKNFLENLNKYRNRLVHRGIFVLQYNDLDEFVGKEVFPFILKLLKLPFYKDSKYKWESKELHCGINPMIEIIKDFSNSKPSYKKIALLKEMGKAAYNNPLPPPNAWIDINGVTKEFFEEHALNYPTNDYQEIVSIQTCPVCGAKSLLIYLLEDPEEAIEYINKIKCICCTFEIDSEIKNIKISDLDINKYWDTQEV